MVGSKIYLCYLSYACSALKILVGFRTNISIVRCDAKLCVRKKHIGWITPANSKVDQFNETRKKWSYICDAAFVCRFYVGLAYY